MTDTGGALLESGRPPSALGAGEPLARARRLLREHARTLTAWLAAIVLPVLFTSLDGNYLSSGNLQSIGRQAAVLLLIALAGTAPILMGSIDLSVGALVSLTSVIAAWGAERFGQGAVFLALPCGLAAGILNGLIVAYLRLPSFLTTLASSFAFAGVALAISGGFPITLQATATTQAHVLDGNLSSALPVSVLWAVGIWLVTIGLLRRTVFGRVVYAIGGNERAAQTVGVWVNRAKVGAFALSGLLCGFAGIIVLYETTAATADVGSTYLLTSIAAVVIGGTPLSGGEGGAGRCLIGTLVLTELVNGMLLLGLGASTQQIVEGAVVIAAAMLTLDRRRIGIVK
ncbi:MAG TPA: ABC transporter permease [Solirubrobacteraceae bacterium]|nr:ABC transporter permease [Solirubrobacteraceae bacterium]